MRTHRKYLPYLYLFLASLVPLFFFIIIVDPNIGFNIFNTQIGAPLFFFLMLMLSLFSLFTFILASRRRGALASLYICGVLILRFYGLKSIFQALIFLIIIILVEYLLSRRTPLTKAKKGPIHKF